MELANHLEMTHYRLTAPERRVYRRFASLALPRHTSYPIVPFWQKTYGSDDLRAELAESARAGRPLSIYVHVPFCERLCYYCACTKEIVTPDKHQREDPGDALLDGLESEVGRFARELGTAEVELVHLGGGSPTFLRPEQLRRSWQILRRHLPIAADAEVAAEVDPRITTFEHLVVLRELGCNRVSLGIQDFAPVVQRAVNRVQSFEMVERFVAWCRSLGFASINFDLIYGLPFQTLDTMADTLEKTLALGPDRIAFYRLAVIPEMFRWQRVFKPADLPAGDLPLELNLLAINRFQEAGYEFIGLDHFARPDEALAQAHRDGSLQRTFQGMTTGEGLNILGLGPSAISQLDGAYAQNVKGSVDWRQRVQHNLATECGLRLTPDDRLRREVMRQLYCCGRIDAPALEERFGIVFQDYFADELRRARELAEEGLLATQGAGIQCTTPLGRLLVRVVAAVFDRYLAVSAFREGLAAQQASKVG
jgi:oxygen-independent coproporphyrinogen III oxidase